MDLVEALDAWIDDRIDDFEDEELEQILDILDAVSASEFADLETSHVYNDDVYALVELVGGDAVDQDYTEDVLRSAFYGDPIPAELFPAEEADVHRSAAAADSAAGDDHGDDVHAPGRDLDEDDDISTASGIIIDGGSALDERDEFTDGEALEDLRGDLHEPFEIEEPHDDTTDLDDTQLDDEDNGEFDDPQLDNQQLDDPQLADEDDGDLDDQQLGDDSDLFAAADDLDETFVDNESHDAGFVSDVAHASALDEQLHNDFLTDVVQAGTAPLPPPEVVPVQLRTGDALGPSFLDDTPAVVASLKPTSGWKQWAVALFMLGGLGAFVFGTIQLFDSLSGTDEVTATTGADPVATEEPTAIPEPTEAPEPTAAAEDPVDPAEPSPTPTPIPTAPPRIGIRLVTGDVMLASFVDLVSPADMQLVYDLSDDDLTPARSLTWLDDAIGVVDVDGRVLVIDPDARRPKPRVVYEAGGGLGEAREIAVVGDRIAIRTDEGDVTLVPDDGRADPDVVEFLWDASEEGARAVDIASVGSLVPFVLDDGNAQFVDTADNNRLTQFWQADDQPPAFNIDASEDGILLGIGQGAVARYRLDGSANPFDTVWNPFEDDEAPAIGYAHAGDRTAIVLGDGAIVLADDTGTGPRVWDPEETEIRALALAGGPTHVTVLLESGSVVRIPLGPDELIASIWDITDETLQPANQVAVESLVSD